MQADGKKIRNSLKRVKIKYKSIKHVEYHKLV